MIFETQHVFHVTRVLVRPCPVKAFIVWRIEKSRCVAKTKFHLTNFLAPADSGDKLIAEAQGPRYQTEDKPIDTFLITANMAVSYVKRR